FTPKVTDSIGATGSLAMSIVINPPVSITTPGPLPQWTQNIAGYSQSLSSSGGTGAATWSIAGGCLPNRLGLSSVCLISGTPTASGNFNFTVQAMDTVGANTQQFYSITINPPVSITTAASLPDGAQGIFYNASFSATGGTGPITWGTTAFPPNSVPGL